MKYSKNTPNGAPRFAPEWLRRTVSIGVLLALLIGLVGCGGGHGDGYYDDVGYYDDGYYYDDVYYDDGYYDDGYYYDDVYYDDYWYKYDDWNEQGLEDGLDVSY